MYRGLLMALGGVALAALLALGVFFASEAALGDDEPVLEPALVSTTLGRTTAERRTTTERGATSVGTTTEDRPTVPTIRTETDDGGQGRGRGRGRGRGGNSGPGGGADDD